MKKSRLILAMVFTILCTAILATPTFAASIAKINNKGYPSLPDAFSNVKDGQTIVMTQNYELNYDEYVELKLSSAKGKVTLDLNKKTLSFPGQAQICVEKGILIIKNGTMKKMSRTGRLIYANSKNASVIINGGSYTGSVCASNGGSLTVDGGTFVAIKTNNVALISLYEGGKVTINKGTFKSASEKIPMIDNEEGTLTINSGTFKYTHKFYDEYSDTCNPEHENGTILLTHDPKAVSTINNATFVSNGLCMRTENRGTVNIKNGQFTSNGPAVFYNENPSTIKIAGGKFTITTPDWPVMMNYGGATTITGGSFTSNWSVLENNDGTLKVTGGTFVSNNKKLEPGIVINFSKTTTISGGTFTGKNTYGYWCGDGKINGDLKTLFKNTKGQNKGDIFDDK